MKRGILIAGGCVAGLGGVLAITPPQFGSVSGSVTTSKSSSGLSLAGSSSSGSSTAAATQSAAPVASATPKATATKKQTQTKAQTGKTAAATTTSSKSSISGTFSGSTAQTPYGPVQVQITVTNGKITAAKALQYPNRDFRSQNISQQAIPYLVDETLQAQSSNIQGVGGASYTSQGWYDSLVSAIAKAGI